MGCMFGIFRDLRGALEYQWSLGQVTAGLTEFLGLGTLRGNPFIP